MNISHLSASLGFIKMMPSIAMPAIAFMPVVVP